MPSSLTTCSIWCFVMLFFFLLSQTPAHHSYLTDWLSPPSVSSAALGYVLTSGCATSRHCQQQELPGVRIHCCDSDLCNSTPFWRPSIVHYICALFSLLLLRLWLWPEADLRINITSLDSSVSCSCVMRNKLVTQLLASTWKKNVSTQCWLRPTIAPMAKQHCEHIWELERCHILQSPINLLCNFTRTINRASL